MGHMLAATTSDPLPSRVGPFRVVSVLGRGGMGIVYRAIDERSGASVALKTITVERELDLVGLRREIHALQRVDHPGVVRILESGVREGVPWYAMPVLEGETLAAFGRALRDRRATAHGPTAPHAPEESGVVPSQARTVLVPILESPDAFLRAGPPDGEPGSAPAFGRLPEVLTIVRRLCATLAFLHGEGIVHRDLTPANVFLVDGEHPKILDFGLFRRFAGDEGREEIEDPRGHAAGTAGYMAPEQIRGELVDARADLFALGCILYELVTGRLPHGTAESIEALARGASPPVLPPSLLVRELSPALERLILKLLEPRPFDRFGHAAELIPILAAHGAREAPWERAIVPRGYVYRPRLVGRARDLRRVDEVIGRTLQRRGGCVLIAGESGVGKTYLATHALRAAAASAIEVLAATCGARGGEGADPELHPFRAVLQAVADRCVGSPELSAKLLGDRGRVLAAIEPRLATLPSVRAAPAPTPLPAEAAQRRLFAALADTLDAFASLWPCVLVLDDLQWADELTLRFLASLPNDWFEDKALLVLATVRAEEEGAGIRLLAKRPWVTRVDLGRLGEPDVRALVRDMLALPEPPDALVRSLARASSGNPFFVAEYLRTAITDGTFARDGSGRWSIDEAILTEDATSARPAPPRIEALVGRRLDSLGEGARTLLSAIVVLGKEVEIELSTRLAALEGDAALEAARELVARQVVEARAGTFHVLHDVIRSTAYDRIAPAERLRLHRGAADLLERRVGAPGFELLHATIAHHAAAANDARRAVRYFELAGERALSTFANRDAIALFEKALHLGDAATLDEATRAVSRARWLRRIGDACQALGDLSGAEAHLSRALDALGEPVPRGLGWTSTIAREAPIQVARRLMPLETPPSPGERARLAEAATALDRLAERAYFGLDALTMVAASLRAVNRAERAGLKLARPYALLGITVGLSKMPWLARRYFDLAREAGEDDPGGLGFALVAEATWYTGEAAWPEAVRLATAAAEAAKRAKNPKDLGMAQTLLAHEHYYRGRFRESAAAFVLLEHTGRANENRQYEAWGLYAGARAHLALGELDRARRMLEDASRLLERQADVPSKLICSGLLAALHLRRGDLDAALVEADRCEARVRESPPTVFSTGDGYTGLVEVRLAALRRERSKAALAAAERALAALRRFAFAIPLGRASAHRLRGELLAAQGRPDAVRAFERARDHARAHGLRYEEALADHALARALPRRSARAEEHRARAERAFAEMSCPAPETHEEVRR